MFDPITIAVFLESTACNMPPMEPERFWELIAQLDWPSRESEEAVKEEALRLMDLLAAVAFCARSDQLAEALADRVTAAIQRGEVQGLAEDWLVYEDPWLGACLVIGHGRDAYAQAWDEPGRVCQIMAEEDENETLAVAICDLSAWSKKASPEEIEETLRRSTAVRAMNSLEGFGDGEIVEHHEHGLGFVEFSEWPAEGTLRFPGSYLSVRRHVRAERHICLYGQDDSGEERFWYASVGSAPYPSRGVDIFTREGVPGGKGGGRIHPPRPREEALARFEALVAAKRAEGYAERALNQRIAVQLTPCGLEENAFAANVVLTNLPRRFQEVGFGAFTHHRTTRDRMHLFFDVVDVDALSWRLASLLDSVARDGVAFRAVALEGGAPARELCQERDAPPFAWEVKPCQGTPEREQPYFSRLTIEPHPETEAWARETAQEATARWADLKALSGLDPIVADLKRRHLEGALGASELAEASRRLGAAAGELVRAEVGGEWGVGWMFTERIWFGLWLGRAGETRVKWWPTRDAQTWIEGKREGSFSARCQGLIERVREGRADVRAIPDRLYPLAAGQGNFDAGGTADGRQVLMAAFWQSTFALFFDGEGRLTEVATHRPMEGRAEGQPEYGPSRLALETWQRELGWSPRLIRVKMFSLSEPNVGIADLPSHYESFLEDPDAETPEEQRYMAESIKRWVEGGDFVLYWGNDLFMSGEGQITST
ncbi:MAG: hypothetical protein CMH57_10690 [Myxococcales bacterium]|nr:hypothetical protein [Myxococcales bacterium]